MVKGIWSVALIAGLSGSAAAQDFYGGAGAVSSQEVLFPYDDQDPWKHGYRQVMPYYGGWHSFRPYNYHHVFGQSQTAANMGMGMPYSQQFWHRYEQLTTGGAQPAPHDWYSNQLGRMQQQSFQLPQPAPMIPVSALRPTYTQPVYSQPVYAAPASAPEIVPADSYAAPLATPALP